MHTVFRYFSINGQTTSDKSGILALIPLKHWIDPVDAADRLAAKLELAGKFYFHFERQELEQRPRKRAFGRANSALVFQEA